MGSKKTALHKQPSPPIHHTTSPTNKTDMPVDYSKWDALELSDDSDFEPHPNVDKRSFIRAKQNQIHQQRAERKHQIETLKYERMINDGLLRRIDTLLAELRSHESEVKDRNAFLYQALIASAGDADDDEAPPPPGGVHSKEGPVRYSQMMGSLADQVKKEVEGEEDWFHAFIKGVEGHRKKVTGLQKQLVEKLAELEKEETRKITSEHIRDGFNSTMVSKGSGSTTTNKTVEVLNPGALKKPPLNSMDSTASGAEGDIDEDIGALQKNSSSSHAASEEDNEDSVEPTALGKQFAKLKYGDYQACLAFISSHPEILTERETDGLLVEAFEAQMKGEETYAKLCVHQALLTQYCRALGRDGVGLFFKRYLSPSISLRVKAKQNLQNHNIKPSSKQSLPRRRRQPVWPYQDAYGRNPS